MNKSSLFLSIDLEMEQPSQEIIQIGACIGDLSTGEVVEKFSQLVTPEQPLSQFITQLTGITQEAMDKTGIPLIDAYKLFLQFSSKYLNLNTNPMTWGGGDTKELKDQVTKAYDKILTGKTLDWPFGRRWLDIKTVFQFRMFALGLKPQAGLAKAMTKVGLNFKGRKHDALDDSVNTFILAHHLVKQSKQP